MWNNTDYDSFGSSNATYGDGTGGGFFNSGDSGASKKISRQNNLIPCTCAEVLSSTHQDDHFVTVGGVEITQVCVIGIIRFAKESETRLDYELDDYTGPYLSIKQFVDNDESVPELERVRPYRELTYVRVYGHVRNLQGTRSIAAFKVTPLKTLNELTAHLASIINCRMILAKQAGGGGAHSGTSASTTMLSNQTSGSAGGRIGGLTAIQSQIVNSVRNYMGEEGISVQQLCNQFRGIPEKKIREDLEYLGQEGHIYSTFDDDHFRTTDDSCT